MTKKYFLLPLLLLTGCFRSDSPAPVTVDRPDPDTMIHVVNPRESIEMIARIYGMSVAKLARINGLEPPYTLHVGQRLLVQAAPPEIVTQEPIVEHMEVIPEPAPVKGNLAPVEPSNDSKFIWPVNGKVIRNFKRNECPGLDIAAKKGTSVRASASGTVAHCGNQLKGFGKLIAIKHDGGMVTVYTHLDKIKVSQGQKVKSGDIIATVGDSGSVDEPQLHFEIRKGTNPLDPKNILSAAAA